MKAANMVELMTGALLGMLLGMRHALEPDHLAAVSTLLGDGAPRTRFRGAFLGAFWGLGHTVALFAVGCALALFHAELPARLADAFELAVATMLIVLGARAITRALKQRQALRGKAVATRPLLIGLVHGLAGSGALTALVVAQLPSTPARLAYIGLFGLGSLLGMALLSGLAGWPLAAAGENPKFLRTLSVLTGAFSTVLGVFWGVPLLGRVF